MTSSINLSKAVFELSLNTTTTASATGHRVTINGHYQHYHHYRC